MSRRRRRRRTRRRPGRACPARGTRPRRLGRRRSTSRRGRLEGPDELAADDLALLLGVGDPGQRGEEPLGGVDDVQRDPGRGDEVPLDLLAPRPPAAARGRRTHRSAGRRSPAGRAPPRPRSRRRRTARRSPAPSPTCARIAATCSSTMFAVGPGRRQPATVVQEVLEHLLAVRRCAAPRGGTARRPAARVGVLERGHRTVRAWTPVTAKPGRRRGDRVAVAHPHRLPGHAREQRPPSPTTDSGVRPYSRVPVGATSPPSACAIAWKP